MLIRLVLLVLAVFGLITVIRWLAGGPRASEFKCASCTHCRKLFHDGVMCGFRDKEVFKSPAQIEMCPDHDPR